MTKSELSNLLRKLGLQKITERTNDIQACCPFHKESRPSWGISITEPHLHGCFACNVGGSLPSLLRHFGWSAMQIAKVTAYKTIAPFKPFVATVKGQADLPKSLLGSFRRSIIVNAYMRTRQVSPGVVKDAGLLYDENANRVVFPWMWEGRLTGVTGRYIGESVVKTLPYFETRKGSSLYFPKGRLLSPYLVLVEGEIDALRCLSIGVNAAAVGFGLFTDEQCKFIAGLGLKKVILCFDSDETGRRITYQAKRKLEPKLGLSKLYEVDWNLLSSDEKMDPASISVADLRLLLTRQKRSIQLSAIRSL